MTPESASQGCERCGKSNPADIHTCSPTQAFLIRELTKAIVNAVPEIVTLYCLACEEDVPKDMVKLHSRHADAVSEHYEPQISLANVLVALASVGKLVHVQITKSGDLYMQYDGNKHNCRWSCHRDRLYSQFPDTIHFLHSLLVK